MLIRIYFMIDITQCQTLGKIEEDSILQNSSVVPSVTHYKCIALFSIDSCNFQKSKVTTKIGNTLPNGGNMRPITIPFLQFQRQYSFYEDADTVW